MRYVYDIETNGLLSECTKIYCLVAYSLDTGNILRFADADPNLPNIRDGIACLQRADLLVGHNVIGFDHCVIRKLYDVDLFKVKTHDTFVMSQVLSYKRPHKHGLKGWGEHLQNSKIEYDDWSHYNDEMMRYCVQDVKLNKEIYDVLLEEYQKIYKRNPLIRKGMEIEHDAYIFNSRVRESGWNFDTDKAEANLDRMLSRMAEIEAVIHPKLGERKVLIDKEPKFPKFKKNGDYAATTKRMVGEYLGRELGEHEIPIPAGQSFQRFRMEPIQLGSMDLVKDWLLANGWVPDEYQKRKVGFEWITGSPKLTSTSLAKMGEIGEMIDEYYTIRNRASVVSGWLAAGDSGRLHGNMWTIGTPTFRCRHEVIVNLPAVTAQWGRELRELFIAEPGHRIVGADSSGNQLRGLCHYVGNDEFTNEVIYGDQHQRNADALGCSRPVAKSYLYAYLFGAGDAKLGQVLTGKSNSAKGKQSRADFAKGIKGLDDLKIKLSRIWRQTDGWFPALDGRPVYCPAEHQTLNYLLQSAEGLTCKAAVSYAMRKIDDEGLRAEPRLFYHDEIAYTSHVDDAERVGEILQEAFKEAPKWFNVNCMDGGDYVIGSSYADVH